MVLCHNHPNGVALPSREDLMATENIVRALGLVKVHLRDRIILTERIFLHAGGQPPAVLRFPDRGDAQAVLIL